MQNYIYTEWKCSPILLPSSVVLKLQSSGQQQLLETQILRPHRDLLNQEVWE